MASARHVRVLDEHEQDQRGGGLKLRLVDTEGPADALFLHAWVEDPWRRVR